VTRPAPEAPWPTAATRLLVLLGWPVRHSLSPVMHNAALREQDLDLVYLTLPTPPDRLTEVVAALGDVEAVGANVTVPHKLAVVGSCDALTEEAALIGAVNTLAWTPEGLLGDNTDATGLRDALADDVGGLRPGARTVLLGTGGAARSAAVAAGRLELRVTVAGRRPERAEELAELAERAGSQGADACDLADERRLRDAVGRAHLVINATPLGMEGESLPEPCHRLAPGQVAYDLVYSPPETPFLHAARAAGAEAHNGLGMLVGQAAASYRRWTGREAPTTTMSAAAVAALAPTHGSPSA
jgi:shikimate dehydrogenase